MVRSERRRGMPLTGWSFAPSFACASRVFGVRASVGSDRGATCRIRKGAALGASAALTLLPLWKMCIRDRGTLVQFRREVHANPELSFREVVTTERLMNRLREAGMNPVACEGTGCYVDIGSGPFAVALRADIDALPIVEQTDPVSYTHLNPRRVRKAFRTPPSRREHPSAPH